MQLAARQAQRMVAMIGIASAADVDTAMTLGLNYPRGPLALADWLGVKTAHEILVQLQAITGDDRYRPSQWPRRAQLGLGATMVELWDLRRALCGRVIHPHPLNIAARCREVQLLQHVLNLVSHDNWSAEAIKADLSIVLLDVVAGQSNFAPLFGVH
jgi:hypothetical protein